MKHLALSMLTALLMMSACSTNSSDAVGRIDGKQITAEQFYGSQRRNYADFSYRMGRNPDINEKKLIFNDTWRSLTQYTVLKKYFDKYDIQVSNEEVIDTLSQSIPAFIQNSPRFKKDGVFDRNLYIQSLLTDRPENQSPLREDYKERVIPIQKLKYELIDNELITRKVSDQYGKILNSEADIDLYIFDPKTLQLSVSDADVAAYYQEHIAEYKLQPYHRLAYCMIPTPPQASDLDNAKAVADSIYDELMYGTSADEIIKMFKQSPVVLTLSKSRYQKASELPVDLLQVFNSLDDGACTKPQPTDKGFVIHQKIQTTKTLVSYNSIYLQPLPSSASMVQPESTARNVMNLALQIGLAGAADEFRLPYHLGNPTPLDSLDIPAGDHTGVILKKLRTAKDGSIFEPVFSPQAMAWMIIEVVENQLEEAKSLTQVSSEIRNILAAKQRMDANSQRARKWVASQAGNFANITPDEQLLGVKATNSWRKNSLSRLYYLAVQSYLDKSVPPVIDIADLIVVPVVRSLKQNNAPVDREKIREAFVSTLDANWFDKWLKDKVSKAKVEIWITP